MWSKDMYWVVSSTERNSKKAKFLSWLICTAKTGLSGPVSAPQANLSFEEIYHGVLSDA